MDEIPNHAFLKKTEVLSLLGIGRTVLTNAMARGTFPQPLELSDRYSLWRRKDIVAWMNGKRDWSDDDGEAAA